jgi:hypothetical protein
MSALRRARYRASKTRLRVPLIWLRHRGLDSSDVFLASYPRSGNTWLRFQLAEILAGRGHGFENINRVAPELGRQGRALPLLPGEGRLIKTHESYRREYKKAVYLVRDVRDVALSKYTRDHGLGVSNYWGATEFDKYLLLFLQGKVAGFGPWQDHVHAWLDSPLAESANLLVVKYEDLRQDTDAMLQKIVEFLGADVSPTVIRDAVRNNSLEKMRAKEDTAHLPWSNREEGRYICHGSVAGWRAKLTDAQLQCIHQYAGSALERIGYPVPKSLTAGEPGSLLSV